MVGCRYVKFTHPHPLIQNGLFLSRLLQVNFLIEDDAFKFELHSEKIAIESDNLQVD